MPGSGTPWGCPIFSTWLWHSTKELGHAGKFCSAALLHLSVAFWSRAHTFQISHCLQVCDTVNTTCVGHRAPRPLHSRIPYLWTTLQLPTHGKLSLTGTARLWCSGYAQDRRKILVKYHPFSPGGVGTQVGAWAASRAGAGGEEAEGLGMPGWGW